MFVNISKWSLRNNELLLIIDNAILIKKLLPICLAYSDRFFVTN